MKGNTDLLRWLLAPLTGLALLGVGGLANQSALVPIPQETVVVGSPSACPSPSTIPGVATPKLIGPTVLPPIPFPSIALPSDALPVSSMPGFSPSGGSPVPFPSISVPCCIGRWTDLTGVPGQ